MPGPDEIREAVQNMDSLPTLPGVVTKLMRTMETSETSLAQVGKLIASDQVLSVRVLKMINSPVYGFPGRISSITQALILLGLTVVKGMVFGASVFEMMEKTVVGLWRHSLGTATAAKVIAQYKGLKDPDELFTAGLIHDLGKVVFNIRYREEYREALALVERDSIPIREAEEKTFGLANHAEVGGWMVDKWNFPGRLTEAILYHHKPHLARRSPELTATVHLADCLVRAHGFGFGGDPWVPKVNPAALEALGIGYGDLRQIVRNLDDALALAADFAS